MSKIFKGPNTGINSIGIGGHSYTRSPETGLFDLEGLGDEHLATLRARGWVHLHDADEAPPVTILEATTLTILKELDATADETLRNMLTASGAAFDPTMDRAGLVQAALQVRLEALRTAGGDATLAGGGQTGALDDAGSAGGAAQSPPPPPPPAAAAPAPRRKAASTSTFNQSNAPGGEKE